MEAKLRIFKCSTAIYQYNLLLTGAQGKGQVKIIFIMSKESVTENN